MKKLVIASLIMILVGVIICGAVYAVKGPDILNQQDLVERSYDVDGEFTNISIDVISNDVLFEVATDGVCHVESLDEEGMEHEVCVEGDTLVITSENDINTTIHFLSINTVSPRITVYLPEEEYGNLDIDADTSDVFLDSGITFDSVDITITTGDITIKDFETEGDITMDIVTGDANLMDVTCTNLNYNGTTSDIWLQNVIVAQQMNIDISTGDVIFDRSDAFSISVDVTTGDIEGLLLSAKSFDCSVITGDISIPRDGNGGNCHLHIGTGDISIDVA